MLVELGTDLVVEDGDGGVEVPGGDGGQEPLRDEIEELDPRRPCVVEERAPEHAVVERDQPVVVSCREARATRFENLDETGDVGVRRLGRHDPSRQSRQLVADLLSGQIALDGVAGGRQDVGDAAPRVCASSSYLSPLICTASKADQATAAAPRIANNGTAVTRASLVRIDCLRSIDDLPTGAGSTRSACEPVVQASASGTATEVAHPLTS